VIDAHALALSGLWAVSAKYQVPEGFNPALGYDVMEMTVAR
jgi:hypothetical protein